MELIGSMLLVAGVALVVTLFIMRPFLGPRVSDWHVSDSMDKKLDHQRSGLLAERDRVLTALQELDFDNTLGKVPEEEYREQRALLLKSGADALRKLDEMDSTEYSSGEQGSAERGSAVTVAGGQTMEERIEAAVAARRADLQRGMSATAENKPGTRDDLEDIIASRKRQRKESAAGFCPSCGRPAQKSDKFCSRCGVTL